MTAKSLKRISFIYSLIFFISHPCFAQDYSPFKGIIHVETNISIGVYSPAQVLDLARKKGIKIVIFTDSFLRRWEYGIRPLENLIKIMKDEPSVVKYGIKKYLREIDNLNKQFPDMVILGGTEVAPFNWWEGNPFKKEKIFNFGWIKHLHVIGLSVKDYEYLPVVSKRYILPQNLRGFILVIFFISLIFLGIFLLFTFRVLGYIIIILGMIFLINNFPFLAKYDIYHGDRGYKPYQEFIDYVRNKGGFVTWAHPTGNYSQSLGRINIITLRYPDVITNTFDYDAFAGLTEADNPICFANREWDTVLREFCLNNRKNPVWVVGDIDYDGWQPKQKLEAVQTVFFLKQLNNPSVFEALKKGRVYARRYTDDIYIDLESFSIAGKIMGETAQIDEGKPKLVIKGSASIGQEEMVKLEIIREGNVLKIFEIPSGKFALEFIDNTLDEAVKKTYYRLNFFVKDNLILVSNPIFCEMK